ncbi:MAG: hypothetical protein H0V51_03470, partial [Chloroflexi bacterium]|nr:hypothetical protein [Chloroflexota bacterium]
MGTNSADSPETTLRDYLGIAQRRKWIILQALLLVPAAAVAFSLTQTKLYQGTAEVLLSRQNLAAALTGTQDATLYQQEDRLAQTQSELAAVPVVAERVLRRSGLTDRSAADIAGATSITARTNSDLLQFSVIDPDPAIAARLATAYAQTYTEYRSELDTAPIQRARREVKANLADLRAAGEARGALYASLVEKVQQLGTLEALQTSNAFVVRQAEAGVQVQPRPKRNAILGVLLGLALGIGLAFLRDAFDTRVRTAEEIGERLGLPLLARVPKPPRRLQKDDRLVMLADPTSIQAEAFRVLRTNLDFARLDRSVRSVMITSAVELEGKSTTIANLAVALARAGERVILADLDLRRPYVERFFDLHGPGLTDVALGHAGLDEALVPILIPGAVGRNGKVGAYDTVQDVDSERLGSLRVLPVGPLPPDPGEFVGSRRLEGILAELRERADTVLLDAPPVLHVGDAMTLSTK